MVDTAFNTLYRREYIEAFERNTSLLRSTVTTEANVGAEKAVFLVTSSNREAVTRGSNGLIPAAVGSETQYECALQEWHDKPQKTEFDVIRAQADQRRIMQMNSISVINRKIDDLIIDQLETATVTAGSAATMSKALAGKALTTLFTNNVPNDGQVYGLITPAAWEYLTDVAQFSSVDYVNIKPNTDGPPIQGVRWKGCLWMMHTGLPGMGTSSATCFVYHRSAIGHAYNGDVRTSVGWNDEDAYFYARASIYMGAKLLQNSGVVKILHNDSALIGS